jgi:hypothetical protein
MPMAEKLAVFVVGHEHWGKSFTLRALEGICDHRGRCVTIREVEFLVRKMSNDDQPKGYITFMDSISRPHVIAALCPKFKKLRNYNNPSKVVDGVLRGLRERGYRLLFWVIEHKWGAPSEVVSREEMSELRNYGTVEVFGGVGVHGEERAREFRRFVASIIDSL